MEGLARWLDSYSVSSPWLYALAAAVALFLIFLPAIKKRPGLAVDLHFWTPRVAFRSRRLWVMSVPAIVVSLLLAAALAEPRVTVTPNISIYGKPVIAVVDVSGSMGAQPKKFIGGKPNTDVRTSYEKARDIFNDLIGRRPDVNFALLLYSTENYVARTFSYKNELLMDTLENKAEVFYISTGTRTADALARARVFLTQNVLGKDKAIVLISDLQADTEAMLRTAEEMERETAMEIKVYVIVITADGQKPADAALSAGDQVKMVEMNDKAGIDGIVDEISKMQNSPIRREQVAQKQSVIPHLVFPALVLILGGLALTETRFRKIP